MSIHPDTGIGAVALTVRDLDRASAFYEQAIGLRPLERDGGSVRLGVEEGKPLVELVGDPDAPPRPAGTTGLYHQAILVPTRADLAVALRRVLDAGWRFSGASDHLVSEALYLDDPERNGIEIYYDRPREQWHRVEGEIQMGTEPLDLRGLMAELPGDGDGGASDLPGLPRGTRIGHVHLNVADLGAAEAFYGDLLGLDVTVRGYPGALFVAAGGYHHHLGLNTWAGEGAPIPPPGSLGLRAFEVVVPDAAELERAAAALESGGVAIERDGGTATARDPSGNRLVLRSAA